MAKRSNPHARTRNDHASETAEDYVEAIAEFVKAQGLCRVSHLAAHFEVSHVTVVRIIARLEGEGLVTTAPRMPIELTRAGLALAERCRERHEVVYRFLIALGVSPAVARVDSEGIEHHVSAETLDRLRAFADQEGQDAGTG